MKLIVKTASHGIAAGEYQGDKLRNLLADKRYSVTSLVSRGYARWVHDDHVPAQQRPATKTDQPAS